MQAGFHISKLVIKGVDCEPAIIGFNSKFHVIIGPSNTGKTYIFECLRYMLGSTKLPKKIKESFSYQSAYIEIKLPNNESNVIYRSLSGGDALHYNCPYDELDNYADEPEPYLVGRKATKKNRTLSEFYLEISNLSGKKVRRNKSGVTDNFSFSDFRNLSLIDEKEIIKDDSPIITGQFGEETKEKSILRMLLTGKDDANIFSKPKQKVIENRKGRLEIIETLINEYQNELAELEEISINEDELESQIQKLENSILENNRKLNELYTESRILETTVNDHWRDWKDNESRLITINESLSRFDLLNQHYDSDIERLNAIQETGNAFSELKIGNCPICNSEIVDDNHDGCGYEDFEKILNATIVEIKKINTLKIELNDTTKNLEIERDNLTKTISVNKESHRKAQEAVTAFVSEQIKNIVNYLDKLRLKLREVKRALRLVNKLKELEAQKNEYQFEIDPMDGEYEFEELTTSTTTDLCAVIKEILISWDYDEISSLSFSEETTDIIINGLDRNLSGKGYRALTYSAFIIGLMQIAIKNKTHSGVIILDSPLCTLRSRHFENKDSIDPNDVIKDNMKEAFYSSIADLKDSGQIIVLDNDGPVDPSSLEIGYTEFTKNHDEGRFGFYPLEN